MDTNVFRRKTGETAFKIKKDIDTHIEWFERISREQRELLKNYLLHLDRSHRVDVNSEKTLSVHRDVDVIMERISEKITEVDPRFTGSLVRMGSAHNQTKLGQPDEFDYVYELDLNALFEGRGSFQRKVNNDIVLKMDGDVRIGPDKVIVLDMDRVRSRLGEIIRKVLSELELPIDWQHGGINVPGFFGLRRQGPSFVLQFDYLATGDQVPLRLSVDFVAMIKLPLSADDDTAKSKSSLKGITEIDYCWVSTQDGDDNIHYGHAEEEFLDKYSWKSTEKKLMRICKALRVVLDMHLTSYPWKGHVGELLSENPFIESGEIIPCPERTRNYTKINSSKRETDYVSFSDLGETGADNYMVKSYAIKRKVMDMMYKDKSYRWTDDQLPDLVVHVYRWLVGFYTPPGGELVNRKISIPLEDVCKETTPTGSPHTQKRTLCLESENSIAFRQRETYYDKFKESKNVHCLSSRIAGIFHLFRCVCEGKRTAELVVYDEIK